MRKEWAPRAAVAFASLSLALAVALWLAVGRARGVRVDPSLLRDDAAVRDAVVARLVDDTAAVYDSHNDGDVGRVLQPRMRGRELQGVRVRSNRFGMREREYEVPKPEGLRRVVLLGDSLVFGEGCPQDERAGAVLEELLRERARGSAPELEVLHLAIASWNTRSECEYLRRQLSLLRPDLVLHLTTNNDLDDVQGTRGFGEKAAYGNRHRERADARVESQHPIVALGLDGATGLVWGLDWESRTRYEEARASLLRLRDAVEATGGRYVVLLHWSVCAPAARRWLLPDFATDALVSLPDSFWNRRENWIGPTNPHWNARGMRQVAELLYGVIRARGLLDGLELGPSEEAERMLALVASEGRAELEQPYDYWERANPLDALVDFAALAAEQPAHFHGGVDKEGRIGPYASIALRCRGARELVVRGRGLERPEIDGLRLRVYADEVLAQELVVRAGEPFEVVFPLPPALAARAVVDARFEASDYAYAGLDLQHCVSARLERVELR